MMCVYMIKHLHFIQLVCSESVRFFFASFFFLLLFYFLTLTTFSHSLFYVQYFLIPVFSPSHIVHIGIYNTGSTRIVHTQQLTLSFNHYPAYSVKVGTWSDHQFCFPISFGGETRTLSTSSNEQEINNIFTSFRRQHPK